MDVQHGHARLADLGPPLGVVQRKHLHAAAPKAFYAVAGAADDEQARAGRIALQRHVGGQLFAVAPRQRVLERRQLQPGDGARFQKLHARLGVAGGKRFGNGDQGAGSGAVVGGRSAKKVSRLPLGSVMAISRVPQGVSCSPGWAWR